MAGYVAITVCQGPSQCQCAFFMFPKVTHAKNHSAVMSRVKNSKTTWMTWYYIVRVRIDVNIPFWNIFTVVVEIFCRFVKEFKVHNPRIHDGCMILWNHKMSTSRKFLIKTNHNLCRNPFFIATIIHSITSDTG